MTEQQIEAAAAAMAEKANGGRFADPLFYAPEHREFWREVVKAGFTAIELEHALVPKYPTEKMCEAGAKYYHDNYQPGHAKEQTSMPLIWEEMVRAAQ